MCGIAGIVDLEGLVPDRDLLRRMCTKLAHRGPDDEGYHFCTAAALGHRRLSIVDLSTGKQPMGNEDGTVWVTFNGEIYNFEELRDRLRKLGHRFATRSDTEVIVHAYEEFGTGCVEYLRGMFAFALWDKARQVLFLARDRAGKKPLFYCRAGGQFLFASELQALLAHPAVRREPDLQGLDDYLTYGYVPAPRTAFRDIWKLPPACRLVLKLGSEPTIERYWQLRYEPKLDIAEDEAPEALREVLTEAVRLRMIADVPVGALLSGGLDSSLVVALMAGLSTRPVRTFSIGFDESSFNELSYARLVARHFGSEHHELIVRPSAVEVLPLLVRHYGEPFADSSAVPSYYLARLTRPHVKAVLNGDGGDECFAGYERYLGGVLADRYGCLPGPVRSGVACCAALIPNGLSRRSRLAQAKRFLRAAHLPAAERYLRWVGCLGSAQKAELYTDGMQNRLLGHRGEDWLLTLFEEARRAGAAPLDRMLATDVASYLPYDLLVKMDIATMANSLEARSPFLDHKVLEFAARLPVRQKLRGGALKYVLKRTAEGLLPPAVMKRRKMGFGVPVAAWMRGELRPLLEDLLLSPRALGRGYFRRQALEKLIRAHLAGAEDHSTALWALLWLELWHREFLD